MISQQLQAQRDQELIKIKKVNMERVLSDLGVPVQQIGKTRMFKAFWRSEKTASCQIMPHKGSDEAYIYQDFGGKNGTNIDLAVFAKGSYGSGVKWLRNQYLFGHTSPRLTCTDSRPIPSRCRSGRSQAGGSWKTSTRSSGSVRLWSSSAE